jgi:Ca-activated chloride channel family protein
MLLPDATPETVLAYPWLQPHFATADGRMIINFQCFVMRTPDYCIMLDTCIGADRNATVATIERLVPRRGTSLGQGLLVALNAIAVDAGDPPLLDTDNLDLEEGVIEPPQGWYPSAAIVLLSDGENNEFPDPLVVTDLAVDLGVRVYSIGVGSPEGSVINVEGMSIHTQMNEAMLIQIAETSGGQYYFAGDENNLELIYDDLKPTLSIKPDEMEMTSLFAGFGMLIFLVGGALSFLWFGRVL